MRTEAAVVGAGPAGLIAAQTISSKGFNATVFEEHGQVGSPNHCAGIISVEGFDRLGIPVKGDYYQNTIYGGKLYSSDETCLEIKDRKPRAHIIDRGEFDRYLLSRATDSGAELKTGTRAERVIFTKKGAVGVRTTDYSARSQVLVDAEGVKGRLLSRSGIETRQEGLVYGYNVDLPNISIETDIVEVWFNNDISPGFFTWVVPVSDDVVRCGLGTTETNGIASLTSFIKRRFGEVSIPRIQSGLISTGGPVKNTVHPGLLLVGDVAGQVKPTTGGGVVLGGLCASIAGNSAAKYLTSGNHTDLNAYDKNWRQLYGTELTTMLAFRRMLNSVSDDRLNRLFKAFNIEGMGDKLTDIVSEGDMDMQAGVISKAFSDPEILAVMARVAGRVVLGELLALFGF